MCLLRRRARRARGARGLPDLDRLGHVPAPARARSAACRAPLLGPCGGLVAAAAPLVAPCGGPLVALARRPARAPPPLPVALCLHLPLQLLAAGHHRPRRGC